MINEPINFLNKDVKVYEIATKEILFFLDEKESDCKRFCAKRNISF